MAPRVRRVLADLGVGAGGGRRREVDAGGLVEQRADPAGGGVDLDAQVLVLEQGLGRDQTTDVGGCGAGPGRRR